MSPDDVLGHSLLDLPLWTPYLGDALSILKILHTLPASFSPLLWAWCLAEPSNKEPGERMLGAEKKEKGMR